MQPDSEKKMTLYGEKTQAFNERFRMTPYALSEVTEYVTSLVEVKKACARLNARLGALDEEVALAITWACDQVIAGHYRDQFVVDSWGLNATVNTNVNEVIAALANQYLSQKASSSKVAVSDVNLSQSANDVCPTAQFIALYRLSEKTLKSLKNLESVLADKALELKDVLRVGRSGLRDSFPITFGQVIAGWYATLLRNRKRLESVREELKHVPLGGTVIGTGLGTPVGYFDAICQELSSVTGISLDHGDVEGINVANANVFSLMQSNDTLAAVAHAAQAVALAIGQIANDLYVFSSGPRTGIREFTLPAIAPGSSIMPGKLNPLMPELMLQIMQQGSANAMMTELAQNDLALDVATHSTASFLGTYELLELLARGTEKFTELCIKGLGINAEHSANEARQSVALTKIIDMVFSADDQKQVLQRMKEKSMTCEEAVVDLGLCSQDEAKKLFDLPLWTDPYTSSTLIQKFKSARKA